VIRRLLQGSLRSRLTRLVGIPSVLFVLAVLGIVTQRSFRHAIEQAEASALNLARIQAARLDRALAEAARIPEMHARMFESGALRDEATVQRYLLDVLVRTPGIYGTCLAFEPESFTPGKRNYCPYAYWNDGKQELALLMPPSYDHLDAKWHWYQDPKRLNHPLWTEPFFDEGGGNVVMTTRAVPFHKPGTEGTNREFWGVATIDISLDQLTKGFSEIQIAQSGYILLISPEGRVLSCPDKKLIMKAEMNTLNPKLADAMMPGSEGFIHTADPIFSRKAWVAYTPVQTAGFTLALVYPADEVFTDAYKLLRDLVITSLIAILALFLILLFVARSVTRPVTRLSLAARKIADGDMGQRLDERSNITEVRDLSLSFEKMVRDLRMRMEELRNTTTLKQRMEGELNAARRIQMSMLPREWRDRSDWPQHASVALHAIIQPAREVGGDVYDYRFLDDHRLSILIGDVSGKGVPAALFMAMTQTLFQAHASAERTVSTIMARVNDALCAEAHTGMFVTLLYAMLDVSTGAMEVCNAGHPPPYRVGGDGKLEALHSERNPALGLVRGFQFTTGAFHLEKGDRIFFYTDGVTEALNSVNELYGPERLETLLTVERQRDVESLAKAVISDVQNHSRTRDASDDITVVVVDFTAGQGNTAAGKCPPSVPNESPPQA
jgi:sigma-B regulation protein RsbU (phosphoserine phosphatase)